MKKPQQPKFRESLASRIFLWVMLYVVVILGIAAYVGNYYVLKIIKEIGENGILYVIGVRQMALALTLLFVVTMVVLTFLLRRTIHRLIAPLTAFTQAVDEVARGNLKAKLPVIQSKDEMRRLQHSFSLMQQSLERQMEELKQFNEAKGRIEGEMKVARDIQLSMLPKAYSPAADNCLDIFGHQISAKTVGGDLYDYLIRDGKLFFCIGDVSGKGVPAALVMATTLCEFRIVASHVDDVEKIITYINRTLSNSNETVMFVTFFVGVLELSSGRLRCCNAGHHKPFIIDNEHLTTDNCQFLDVKPGLPIGIDANVGYVVREYDVPAGAMLFLYTDGLTEAMNAGREQFGMERVRVALTQSFSPQNHRTVGPQALIDSMTQAVHHFVGDAPQSDDLTMLAIKYNGNGHVENVK